MADKIKTIKVQAVGLKDIQRELDNIKSSMKEATDPAEMAKLTAEADRLESTLGGVNDKVEEFDLDSKFKEASSAADPLARAVEEVTNEMKDLDSASKEVGDNFEKLTNDQIATELTSVAGGFTAIATSAYALSDALGITNDDTESFVKNIGTGLAVANGFGQGLQGIISAQKLLASATIATTTATKAGTVATRIFNTVVKANPVGLLITALTTAIGVFALFSASSEEGKKSTEELAEENTKLNETLSEQNDILNRNLDLRNLQGSIRDSRRVLEIQEEILYAENALADLRRDSSSDLEDIANAEERVLNLQVKLLKEKQTTTRQNLVDEQALDNERMNTARENRNMFEKGTKEYADWNKEYEKYLDKQIAALDVLNELDIKQANELLALKLDNGNKIADAEKKLSEERLATARLEEDLKIQLIEDSGERELELNRVKYERLIEDTKASSKLSEEEKLRVVKQYGSLQVEEAKKIQKKINEDAELLAKEKSDKAKERSDRANQLILEDSAYRILKVKETYESELIELEEFLEQKLISQEEYNEAVTRMAKEKTDAIVEIEKEGEEEILEKAKMTKEERLQLSADLVGTVSQGINAIADLMQTSSDNEIAAAEGNEAKQEQLRKKAFEEQKKMQIASAFMNMAQGIIAGLGAPFPMNIAMPIVAGVTGAANIAKIKSTTYSGGGGGNASAPTTPSMDAPTRQTPVVNFQGSGNTDTGNDVNAGNSSYTINNTVTVSETEITDTQKTVSNLSNQTQL